MDATSIVTMAAAVTTFVKVLVDAIKVSPIPSPGAIVPILALVLSFILSFVYQVAQGVTMNHQVMAQTALVAILAFGGAVGVTALQNRGNQP